MYMLHGQLVQLGQGCRWLLLPARFAWPYPVFMLAFFCWGVSLKPSP